VARFGTAERGEDDRGKRPSPQAGQAFAEAHGDVDRMLRLELRTPKVRHTRLPTGCPSPRRPSARALATPRPAALRELELNGLLSGACHAILNSRYYEFVNSTVPPVAHHRVAVTEPAFPLAMMPCAPDDAALPYLRGLVRIQLP